MSTETVRADRVRRLLDMIVEEVSLVDRAANKRRFLIVKRSNEMVENNTDGPSAVAETSISAENPSEETNREPNDDTTQTNLNSADEPAEAEDTSTLNETIAALEGLIEAGAALVGMNSEVPGPELAALATKLREVSETLEVAAGSAQETEDKGSESNSDETSSDEQQAKPTPEDPEHTSDKDDRFAQAVSAVYAALQQANELVESLRNPTRNEQQDLEKRGHQSSGTGSTSAKEGDALMMAVQKLAKIVMEQQQRMARVEKRFGLPNSLPCSERPPTPKDKNESWPMDLNCPVDRESVDKNVSFHDV